MQDVTAKLYIQCSEIKDSVAWAGNTQYGFLETVGYQKTKDKAEKLSDEIYKKKNLEIVIKMEEEFL
jgi:hypothetical protein